MQHTENSHMLQHKQQETHRWRCAAPLAHNILRAVFVVSALWNRVAAHPVPSRSIAAPDLPVLSPSSPLAVRLQFRLSLLQWRQTCTSAPDYG